MGKFFNCMIADEPHLPVESWFRQKNHEILGPQMSSYVGENNIIKSGMYKNVFTKTCLHNQIHSHLQIWDLQ
jgi:hypothetical protein